MARTLIILYLILSLILILLGQSSALIDYDFAVGLGMQEDIALIGEIGVEVNRGFAVGDTLVYVPLILCSLFGLLRHRRWALVTTSSVFAISAYWSITCSAMFLLLADVEAYRFVPTMDYWVVLGFYAITGVIGLIYLIAELGKLD